MRMRRRTLLGAVAALPAAAQTTAFPDRPVRYIVPFPPGGLTDVMARLVAQRLSEIWSRPVVVENRAGGNALIGADAVAKAPAGGHTLLAITSTHAVNATLFPNAPYDFTKDLRVVSVLGSLPLVAVVRADSPVRSLEDLIARPQSGPLNGGSSGTGSPPHLGLELLRRLTSAPQNVVHVPYRGGAPSLTDLMGGSLDFIMSNLPECLPHIQSGRLRGLAVTSEMRHPLLPEVPTVTELNRPGLLITNWTGIAVPSGVPAPLLARIGRDVATAMADAGTRQKAEAGGFALIVSAPEDAQRFTLAEVERWRTLIAEAGIKAE